MRRGGKLALLLLLLIAIGVAVTQYLARKTIEAENAALRSLAAEVESLRQENEALSKTQADAAELARLRAEHQELVRLRGEVARLRMMVKAAPRSATNNNAPPSELPDTPIPAGAITSYVAVANAKVPMHQTLVTGGWVTGEGKRAMVLVTPDLIEGESTNHISCQTFIIEAPDEVWAKVGLGEFKAASNNSNLSGVLSNEQMPELMKMLEDTQGVDILSAPQVMTTDGSQAKMQVGYEQPVKDGETDRVHVGPSIDVTPRLAADGSGIELDLKARLSRVTEQKSTSSAPEPE